MGSIPSTASCSVGVHPYGMTSDGGASNRGTVFKLNTDGTGFALVHSFAGGTADGHPPSARW